MSTEALTQVDWSKEQVTGMENVTQKDLGIPYISILQKGSAEVDESHKDYESKKVEGARAGTVINSSTREILHQPKGDAFRFIPCFYRRAFVERTAGEGMGRIVQIHTDPAIETTARNVEGDLVLPNGNILVPTAYFFGVVNGKQAVITMKGSQLKKARALLNMATSIKLDDGKGGKFTPPMFSHYYLFSTIPEANDQGTWWGWQIRVGGQITPDQVQIARTTARDAATEQKMLAAPKDEVQDTPY